MNKLREKVLNAGKPGRSGLGFGAASARRTPSLLLLAKGETGKLEAVIQYVDGCVVNSPDGAPSGLSVDAARGLDVSAGDSDGWRDAAGRGFHFLVIAEETPALVLLSEDMAHLMRAPLDMADSLLRSLEPVALDGLIVSVNGALSVRHQLDLVRLASFTRKPLFAEIARAPEAQELEVLRDSGVVALLLDAAAGAQGFADLRKAIDALPPRRRRRGEREDPAVSLQATATTVEEDDDLDEE